MSDGVRVTIQEIVEDLEREVTYRKRKFGDAARAGDVYAQRQLAKMQAAITLLRALDISVGEDSGLTENADA